MREEPENRVLLYTVMFARAFGIFCCLCLFSYHIPRIVFKDAPWPCRGGGIAVSPLFQEADAGKIPATVKHYTANMTNASQMGLLLASLSPITSICGQYRYLTRSGRAFITIPVVVQGGFAAGTWPQDIGKSGPQVRQ